MDSSVLRRHTICGLIVAALFAAMIALGLSHPSPADDPPAPKLVGLTGHPRPGLDNFHERV
jgi:hypothetical protein